MLDEACTALERSHHTQYEEAGDALARRYVSLATQRHVPTLDLSALFAGTER